MASPTFAALGTTAGGGSGVNVNLPVPAGMAADEVAVILLYIESDTAVTWPANFDLIATAENNTAANEHRLYMAAKRATGADTGNYTVSHGSAWRSGVAFRLSGVLNTGTMLSIVQATQGATTTNGTAAPSLSLTTTTADTLLIYLAGSFNGGATWTPPTGFTEQRDAEEWSVNSLAQAAAASTGSLSATLSASGANTSILAAFPSLAAGATGRPNARLIHRRAVHRSAIW